MADLEFLGGKLCLDFANTVDRSTRGERRHEYLDAYPDLVAWGRRAGVLGFGELGLLLEEARDRHGEAAAVFRRAMSLRDGVQEVFHAVASGQEPAAGKVATIEWEFREALLHSRIARVGDGFGWVGRDEPGELGRILWPIARSAQGLLTSSTPSELRRIRRCPGDEGRCGWLFLDGTKNGTRRWCSMAGCGSRAKMRRLYRRRRDAVDPQDHQRQREG